jgi:NAD(P)-dependent dehydrogenase (short-subunit alcohol dehydrogenase family)
MREGALSGRIVHITGAGRGIGRATALAVARRGARVAVSDIDEATARDTARLIRDAGGVAEAWQLDVADGARFAHVTAQIEQCLGALDTLVNNAGSLCPGSFLQVPSDAQAREIAINLSGTVNGMRAVMPGMLARGRGQIVNMASIAGRIPLPHAGMYSATKFAIVGLTEAVRAEYGASGVTFSLVLPGYVDTALIAGARAPRFPPISRPEDVARAVVAVLRRRSHQRYVPCYLGLFAVVQLLLPTWALHQIGRWTGVSRSLARVQAAPAPGASPEEAR